MVIDVERLFYSHCRLMKRVEALECGAVAVKENPEGNGSKTDSAGDGSAEENPKLRSEA